MRLLINTGICEGRRMNSARKDRHKVLFVEDDFTLSQLYAEYFQFKFEVKIVDSGLEAIRFTDEHEIDAVVLDYKLPDISGLEVLQKIKKSKPNLPVIFITAHGNEEIAVTSFLNGVCDYLKKPFSCGELLSKIEYHIHLKNLSQENRKILPSQRTKISSIGSVNNQRKLEKAIEYIQEQYSEKINIDMVAKIGGMSKRHFSRLFREAFDKTFRDYIIDFRIEKSQEMLKTTTLSITEISFAVGFFDLTHFERMFKKRSGCSPQQYRRRENPQVHAPVFEVRLPGETFNN